MSLFSGRAKTCGGGGGGGGRTAEHQRPASHSHTHAQTPGTSTLRVGMNKSLQKARGGEDPAGEEAAEK